MAHRSSILSGTATQLSDPNAPPTEEWNAEVQNSVVSFGSSAAVAGLYVDLANPGALSVVVSESGTLSYYQVSQPAPGQPFHAGAPSLLSSLSGAQLNTLFTPIVSGCQGAP